MLGFLKKNNPTQVDCQEAYNLWDALTSRYNTIQQVQIWHNFVHDKDFSLLVKHAYMELMDKQANKLEQTMNNYQLALPKRPPQNIHTPTNVEAYEDRFLASIAINMIQENITQQIRFIRTTLTSEPIRKIFIDFLGEGADLYDTAIKYVKLKGWLSIPPLYKQVPPENTEYLDSGEAYQLWDHLSARYDTIEKTQKYQNFAHDVDFKALLVVGLQIVLEKQANILEKECIKFGIILPSRPPKTISTNEGMELYDDELIFRDIFTGMQFIMELHSTALKQTTTNDRLRSMYRKFLNQELSALDNWINYGKMKGWLRPIPMYKLK
ncbi:MAG TPA: DUF3231 domain-containing protein [Desulfotomaculum sp.]|nr:MAG: hypothetical protein JL56_16235 [Desulfotomaculum sp. BICA1-6]HBX22194.1 DUF3231 domain-containing protein [Desulfotomaculum sp.]